MTKNFLFIIFIIFTFPSNADEWSEFQPELDNTVKQVLAGDHLTKNEKKSWFDKTMSHQERLIEKYDLDETSLISEFGEDMMVDHYLFNLKMSVIHPKYFSGWPFYAAEINNIHRVLRNTLKDDSRPVYLAAAILSAIRINETRYAQNQFKKLLDKDKGWANYVIYYSFSNLGKIFMNGAIAKPIQNIEEINNQ